MLYWPPMPRGEIARMIAAAAALTVLLTHPTVAGFTTHARFDTGDGRFSNWNVGRIDHALPIHHGQPLVNGLVEIVDSAAPARGGGKP